MKVALSGLASLGLVLGLAGATLPATADQSRLMPDDQPTEIAVQDAGPGENEQGELDSDAVDGWVTDETNDVEPSSEFADEAPDLDPEVVDDENVGPAEYGASGEAEGRPAMRAAADSPSVAPMAIGPDGGAAPYVYWRVLDHEGSLAGRATFEIQGPATGWLSANWGGAGRTATVTDCVSAPCTGLDLDPDPGEFLVKETRNHTISSNNRYRVRPVTAPDGFVLTSSDAWRELPGSAGTPSSRAWSNDTYDFGDFTVRQLGTFAPRCDAGYVYGLSANGQIRQVAPNRAVSNFHSSASGVSSFNGLGIGYGGETVYAYERAGISSQPSREVEIWEFDTHTGQWATTGLSVHSGSDANRVQFVAGAVDLDSGKYYFGGFTPVAQGGSGSPDTQYFRIWEYDPSGNGQTRYVGRLDTSHGASSTANGDMAFNAAGDLFVIRGSGANTTVFSVTDANLQAASGGTIPSSQSATVTTMENVNGIAFDADGKGYLGSAGILRSYDMPGWTGRSDVVTKGLDSTDLATCSSPPTITLEKFVEGDRISSSDQFRLSLRQRSQVLGEQTTTGNQSGLQDVRVGPLPTVRNAQLTFSEFAAGTTTAANYVSSYTCSVDGEPFSSGSGTTGTITVPPGGQDVVCTFRNAPLIADVTVYKFMADRDGENAEPRPGWPVGMSAQTTSGQITNVTPSAGTRSTGADGSASWSIRFDAHASQATVTVSEQMLDGFEAAEDAVCAVNGVEVPFSGTSHTLPGIKPGDAVVCAFTNKPIPAGLQVDKQWIIDGESFADGDQPTGITAELQLSPAGATSGLPQWGEERTGFVIGDTVTINETTTIDDGEFRGCRLSDSTIVGPGITDPRDLGPAGLEVTLSEESNRYTVTNVVTCQSLTLVKDVLNEFGGDLEPASWDDGLFAQADGAIQMAFDSGERKYVTADTYALTEADKPGYALTDLTCDGGALDPATGRVTVGDGESVTCTFVNTDLPGSVTWAKVAEGYDELLAGSEWELSGPDGATVTVVDCIAGDAADCAGPDLDPTAGRFRLADLAWGEYHLVETKAPPGYVRDTTPYTFTITANELDLAVGAITNIQHDGPALPLTGGLGRDHVYLAGSLALLLSLTVFGATKLHQRRQPRSAA